MYEHFALSSSVGPYLEGAGVFLRPPQLDDWSEWARLRTESRDFLKPWEPTWSPDALSHGSFRRRLRRYAREARADTGYALFSFRRSDGALVGGVTLANVRRGVTQSCTLGYWSGKPFARQGYMADALKSVTGFVFDDLGLKRLEAACLPNNEASQKLLRRIGFSQEGYARKYLYIDGAWRDHLLFALLGSDERPK
jgi:[ribosomal protein S5]-alanine N-acetyltransferase